MAENIRFDNFIQYDTYILDLIVTDESQLFVIDQLNNTSLIHLNSDSRHIYLGNFRPWRLALVQILDYKELAVTTRTNTIIIVDYRNRYTPREIHTDKKYTAVAQGRERDQLVVSCAVCDKVFVSDTSNLRHSVIRIKIDPRVETTVVSYRHYRHKRLNFPGRCATDQFDNLYIPCMVVDPCILKVSSEGNLLVIYELSSPNVSVKRGDILFPSIYCTGSELLVFWSFIFLRSQLHVIGKVNMVATYYNRRQLPVRQFQWPLFSQRRINPFKMYISIS